MIYLDNNATTAVYPEVREAMLPFFADAWGNPSSSYRFGSRLKSKIEDAREQVAELIGAGTPHEVLFSSGGTESNNAAIHAAIHKTGKTHIVTSQVEHSSVLGYCRFLEKFRGYKVTYLPVNQDGLISISDLESAIGPDTALVSLMWANNETGVLFPVEEIGGLCRDKGALFHCDAVQAGGKLPMKLKDQPIDYLSLTGHKIGAAKGSGSLYIHHEAPFVSFVNGGQQENMRRAGTENVAGIIGMGVAAGLSQERMPVYESSVRQLRDAVEKAILEQVPGAEINGYKAPRLSNTSNLYLPGLESAAVVTYLDSQGICVSSGSACTEGAITPSHVVLSMWGSHQRSSQSIRISLSASNTMEEMVTVCQKLQNLTEFAK